MCVCESYLLSATLYPLHKRCTNCVGPDDAGPIIAIGALLPIDFSFINSNNLAASSTARFALRLESPKPKRIVVFGNISVELLISSIANKNVAFRCMPLRSIVFILLR